MSASHQAGHILIEITDDGRGLNTEKILKKARERGLVAEGQNPSENEIFFLIFEPGFSTAEWSPTSAGAAWGWTWSAGRSPDCAAASKFNRCVDAEPRS